MRQLSVILLLALLGAISMAQTIDISAWAYQLQNVDLAEIAAATSFDLIIIDYSSDGTADGEWSYSQIASVRASGKTVISYISIGEAEDYRWYWNPAWETSPPAWLGPENPDWAGNYKVRFWYADWQNIILSYLDRIIAQGFDGAYLDIVDAYYYWQVENPEQPFADTLMIRFIERINDYADSVTGHNFYVFPQNAESIIDETNVTPALGERYFSAIDAIGIEDVFFYGDEDENNPLNPDEYRIAILDSFIARGKKVCSIEYLTLPGLIATYLDSAHAHSFYPYATRRALDTLYSGLPSRALEKAKKPEMLRIEVFPNPFNSSCEISVLGSGFSVLGTGEHRTPSTENRIEIFDLNGKLVWNIAGVQNFEPLQNRAIVWHTDNSISSGIYLIKATVRNGQMITKRVVYLK